MLTLRDWVIYVLSVGCVICLFTGYMWRASQENLILETRKKQIIANFLTSIEKADAPVIMFDRWNIYKRSDMFWVIKKEDNRGNYAKFISK